MCVPSFYSLLLFLLLSGLFISGIAAASVALLSAKPTVAYGTASRNPLEDGEQSTPKSDIPIKTR